MANANLNLLTTANIFLDWLTLTNNEAQTINELRNGNFYKDGGNFTVANGTVLITSPTGTSLSVTANASVSNLLSTNTLAVTGNSTFSGNVTLTGGCNVANINVSSTANVANLTVGTSLVDLGTALFAGPLTANRASKPGIVLGIGGNSVVATMNASNSSANSGLWEVVVQNTGIIAYRTGTDDTSTAFNNYLAVYRANVNVTQIVIGNLTDSPSINLVGTVNIAGTLAAGAIVTPNAAIYANGTAVVQTSNINFNNTATINVSASANGATQGNIAFNINTSMNLVSLNVSGNSVATAHRDKYANVGVVTTNININCASGVYQDLMLTSNPTITFQNAGISGIATTLTLYVRQSSNGSNTVTWANTIRWSDNNIPVLSTTTNTADAFTFTTFNGGTIWIGSQIMGNVPAGNSWFI